MKILPREDWEGIWGIRENSKKDFRGAYAKAVAPLIAGVVDFSGKKDFNVLILGGGKGEFSDRIIPVVQKILTQHGNDARINVVETDFSEVIEDTPDVSKRVFADFTKLPFRRNYFDLVFGQSVVDVEGPEGLRKLVSQVRRVMNDRGFFIHLHEITPAPELWTGQDWNKAKPEDALKIVETAHATVGRLLHSEVERNYLAMDLIRLKNSELYKHPGKSEVGGLKIEKHNIVKYVTGASFAGNDPAIPKGKLLLEYECPASLIGQRPLLTKLRKHIISRGFMNNVAVGVV